jgi:TonB family protein
VYHGSYKSYHKNGKLKEEGSYEANRKFGLWKSYYENGQQEDEIQYEEERAVYKQHWDESGNEHLVNGSGRYTQKYNELEQHYEIEDYRLIASYSISPERGDTTYLATQETTTYKGGMPGLYERIGKTLRYPADARRKGIQGKVFVEFTVDKEGKVRDVKTIKGPHPILNEEAERVMRMMNDWTPGKVRGKPVAQKMVLPLVFKLG